jgi:hypothetical protein
LNWDIALKNQIIEEINHNLCFDYYDKNIIGSREISDIFYYTIVELTQAYSPWHLVYNEPIEVVDNIQISPFNTYRVKYSCGLNEIKRSGGEVLLGEMIKQYIVGSQNVGIQPMLGGFFGILKKYYLEAISEINTMKLYDIMAQNVRCYIVFFDIFSSDKLESYYDIEYHFNVKFCFDLECFK